MKYALYHFPLFNPARGVISGAEPFGDFGQRLTLATGVAGDDVWDGTAVLIPRPPTAGEQMTLVSTSISDTSAGTGIRSLEVHYLDANGSAQVETVTLNGTTPVNTVATNIRFVNDLHALTVGSGESAAGTITCYNLGAATTIYNQISAGSNRDVTCSKMVPAGKNFFLTGWSCSGTAAKPLSVRLRATAHFGQIISGCFFLRTLLRSSMRSM